MVSLVMILLVGFAALTVDGGYLFWTRTQLQATADAACLAGAAKIPANNGTLSVLEEADVIAEALAYVEKNMAATAYGTVLASSDSIFGYWDNDGTHGAARTFYPEGSLPPGTSLDALTLITRQDTNNGNSVSLFFAPVLGIDEMEVVTAAACWSDDGDGKQACILSLHPTFEGAIEMSGTNVIDLGDCGIAAHSNSEGLDFKISGTTDLTVGEVCVKGDPGVDQSGTVTWHPGPEVINTRCRPPQDPLRGVPEPSVGACNVTDFVVSAENETHILSPGVYCNGIEIAGNNATIDFLPGVYILKGGAGLIISGSNGEFTGDNVMFYNTHDSGSYGNIDFAGSSNIFDFSAPTPGAFADADTYAGILFFQDRDASPGDFLWKLAGASNDSTFDGVIYMPDQEVQFSGDADITGPCGPKIISSTVTFNGNSITFPIVGSGCASDFVDIPLGEMLVLVM